MAVVVLVPLTRRQGFALLYMQKLHAGQQFSVYFGFGIALYASSLVFLLWFCPSCTLHTSLLFLQDAAAKH